MIDGRELGNAPVRSAAKEPFALGDHKLPTLKPRVLVQATDHHLKRLRGVISTVCDAPR
jgi:hypothetical protein